VSIDHPDTPGPARKNESSGGLPAAQLQAATKFVQLFGAGSDKFSAVLVTLGTTFAAFSMAARLDDPKAWGSLEFLPALGFSAILVLLGFIEERFVVRSPKTPPYSGDQQSPRELPIHMLQL
jgi:hypothetical protein